MIRDFEQLSLYISASSTTAPPENSDGVEDPPLETDHKLTGSTESSVDLTDVDLLTDAFVDNEVVRSKTFLFVSDLARKGPYFHGTLYEALKNYYY